VLFLQEWNRELEAIRRAPDASAANQQEERLYRAVKEALVLAREARRPMAGVIVRNVEEGAVKSTAKARRRALKTELSPPDACTVLLPVTKIDNGGQFRYFYDALAEALGGPVAGAVLVYPTAEPRMGPATKTAFDKAVRDGKLRVFSLQDQAETAVRLECLLRFLDLADAQELRLGGQTLSKADCQDLILKTAVLDNLELYK
jgi:hypothetical protein